MTVLTVVTVVCTAPYRAIYRSKLQNNTRLVTIARILNFLHAQIKSAPDRRRGAHRALARNASIPPGEEQDCEASWRRVLFFSAA